MIDTPESEGEYDKDPQFAPLLNFLRAKEHREWLLVEGLDEEALAGLRALRPGILGLPDICELPEGDPPDEDPPSLC